MSVKVIAYCSEKETVSLFRNSLIYLSHLAQLEKIKRIQSRLSHSTILGKQWFRKKLKKEAAFAKTFTF